MRLLHQKTIKAADLQEMMAIVVDFEQLYYKRKKERLHFCRPCIHVLGHLAREVTRLGPCSIYSQWLLGRTFGNLTSEIRQFSHVYANVSQCGLLRAQTNPLRAMVPDLDPETRILLSNSCNLSDNCILHHPKDEKPIKLHGAERIAMQQYLEEAEGKPIPNDWKGEVQRWARVEMSDNQYIRSAWKEEPKPLDQTRISRVVKTKADEIAEIRHFFQAKVNGARHGLALVSLFSSRNDYLYEISSGTLRTGTYRGNDALRVIGIKIVVAGVAMIPWMLFGVSIRETASLTNTVTNDATHSGLTVKSSEYARFKEGQIYFEVDKLTLGLVEKGTAPAVDVGTL
ncbi:hypothetical protein QCA50_017796 [Cerrena zonata]|uniref:Uncharacterized protein n=1 Tax=Cerrena zonata TaxID=2478898 RepID=A0AAW0FNU9_9APHY